MMWRGPTRLPPRIRRSSIMTDPVGRTLDRLSEQPLGRVSMASDDGYAAARAFETSRSGACRALSSTAGRLRTCASPFEPRACGLPLSVRGGGDDWTGRALCDGVVIDLGGMRSVAVASNETAEVSGGARFADILAATDLLGLAPVIARAALLARERPRNSLSYAPSPSSRSHL